MKSVSAKRRAKVRLAHNSTFAQKDPNARAVARKRSDAPPTAPTSSHFLKQGSGIGTGKAKGGSALKRRNGIPKSNPARRAKRRAEYRKKLAAYRRSETYKIVEARAENRCECMVPHSSDSPMRVRCFKARDRGDRLTHHHRTYARFGGTELPEDVVVLCNLCNAYEEMKHPTRRRDWK